MGKGWKAAKKKSGAVSLLANSNKKAARSRRNAARWAKVQDAFKRPKSWDDWPTNGLYKKERVTNNGFAQEFCPNGMPCKAATLFGTILDELPQEDPNGLRLFLPSVRQVRHIAGGRAKKKTKEQIEYEKYNTDTKCYSMDTNYFHVTMELKKKLKNLYDPSGKGRGELYTLKNLCKRESLKFDKDVRFWLNLLWNAVDDGA